MSEPLPPSALVEAHRVVERLLMEMHGFEGDFDAAHAAGNPRAISWRQDARAIVDALFTPSGRKRRLTGATDER